MKATRIRTKSGATFRPVNITFHVTANHLLNMIMQMLAENTKPEQITKKNVWLNLKQQLSVRGENWCDFNSVPDNSYDSFRQTAKELVAKLFPDFKFGEDEIRYL